MASVDAASELRADLEHHLTHLSGKKPLSADQVEHHLTHVRDHSARLGHRVKRVAVLGKAYKEFDLQPTVAAVNYVNTEMKRRNGSTRFHVTVFVAPG